VSHTNNVAGHATIAAAIRAAAARGEPALVAFLTAGFPARDAFASTLARVAAHADVVEIGVPFTDPMADGMTIQRASHAALAQGVSLGWILDSLRALSVRPAAPLLLMSYLNPLLAFGIDRLPIAARDAGVAGFIVPDLPFEEAHDLREALAREGIALVQMVTPVTPPDRLAKLCATAQGFIYAVTMTGTTGKSVAVPDAVLEYLDRVRALAPIPVCAGFGIRGREQVARLGGHVDGVVVGSALVEVLERGEDPATFLDGLRLQPPGAPAG
jgi:tryptophan synthase alpha chain